MMSPDTSTALPLPRSVPMKRDEPRRNDLAGRVLALSGFHLVTHQHAHGGLVAGGLGANAHRICHVDLLEFDG
jgi:hypothetical protein